jgi:hypothetical protein
MVPQEAIATLLIMLVLVGALAVTTVPALVAVIPILLQEARADLLLAAQAFHQPTRL